MRAIEINYDGLVGPTHNYAGLSLGNVASATNSGSASSPRAAALQGIAKMRALVRFGLTQGVLPPQDRPHAAALAALGFGDDPDAAAARCVREDPQLFAALCSASPMWTANAATVSPSADAGDGRLHVSIANLAAMPHRSLEPDATFRALALAFPDGARFAIHRPLPGGVHFGDEGAANHMRLAPEHGAPGVEIFVYGGERSEGRFPARQRLRASQAIARRHALAPERVVFLEQAPEAIQAGAFHNDVVAVANQRVLFAHARAFTEGAIARIRETAPFAAIIETPEEEVSLADAIATYLFNAQLLSLPNGQTLLLAPRECREHPGVAAMLDRLLGQGRGIDRVETFDLRESMRNGGGPACLRLRVVATAAERAALDPRFLVDEATLDRLEGVIATHYPERIAPADLGDPALWAHARGARAALLDALKLSELR